MKKNFKKILSTLLSVSMILSSFAFESFAEDENTVDVVTAYEEGSEITDAKEEPAEDGKEVSSEEIKDSKEDVNEELSSFEKEDEALQETEDEELFSEEKDEALKEEEPSEEEKTEETKASSKENTSLEASSEKEEVELFSEGEEENTQEQIEEISISEARELVDTTVVKVNGIATKAADGYWYIQDTDAGIAVKTSVSLESGNVVKVTGVIAGEDNFKYIDAAGVEILSEGSGMPLPTEATVKDIYNGMYQGMLVKIIGCKIVSMDSENITIRDDNDATVIQVVYSSELNNGMIKDAKVDVLTIATARANNHILRMTEKNNMTISVVPSEISTEEELDAIRNNMYGNYILTNNIELTKYWVPLGTAERPFYGKLNGNSKTISGMDIQCDLEYWYQYAGFIGYMGDGASVMNLTVTAKEGGSVKAKTQSGSTYAGGIVGYANNATVDNCKYYGVVEGATFSGYIMGAGYRNSTIKNCKDIEIADGSVISGGIVNELYGTIENCSVISGKIDAGTRDAHTGGIAGLVSGTVKDCFVTAESVTGRASSKSTGGAIGVIYSDSTVSGCYSTADVSGANTASRLDVAAANGTGGFAGCVGENADVINCYAKGDVKGANHTGGFMGCSFGNIKECYSEGDVEGSEHTGGFAGIATGTLSGCYATGDAKGTNRVGGFAGMMWMSDAEDCNSEGSVSGIERIGGFVGFSHGTNCHRCYSCGDVKGTRGVGGFCGYVDNYEYLSGVGYIERNSVVSECYAASDARGVQYVGGFVGETVLQEGKYTTFNNCYTFDGDVYGKSYTGGFAGNIANAFKVAYCYSDKRLFFDANGGFAGNYHNTNGITRCYYNKEINPRITDTAAAGKTTQQLSERATYLDWDFIDMWEITTGFNNGMPYVSALKDTMEQEVEYMNISTEDELINIRYDTKKNYRLAKDIELTKGWVPVEHFYGIFDGNGYSITNLTLADYDEYVYSNGAMFGVLELGSEVKNLTVKGDTAHPSASAAILAGVNYGSVADCHVIGTVDGVNAGGIVDTNYGYIGNSDANVTVKGKNNAGGFVRYNENGNIENCFVKGSVSGEGAVSTGGFIAHAGGECLNLSNCYSLCDVTGGDNTGGFIGKLEAVTSQIYSCSSDGKIVGTSDVGGFIGTTWSASGQRTARIHSGFSKGSVYSSGNNAGGFIGRICAYSSQRFDVYVDSSYSAANVKGSNYIGGFVGSVDLYGRLYANDCYASDGKIVGETYVGGFLGYKYNHDSECVVEMTRCLSRSYLAANTSSYAFAHNGKVERCYYDNERTLDTDAQAAGKTSEQLKDQATYLDWDFATVWATDESINGGYPYLRSIEELDGSEDEYTLITNEQELINIRYNLDGKFKIANDITLSYNWIPIGSGTDTNTFNGQLDGDGHTIYGFRVPCDEEYEFEYAAMFASISPKAVIENLNIVCGEDKGVATKNFGSTKKSAAGFVVNNYGVIRNSSFTGSVSSEYYSGGIAANNYNTIENCHVNSTNIYATVFAGGIAATNTARIVGSSFTGNLTSDGWGNGECFAGGIVAKNSNHISNCEVLDAVINAKDTMGGIAGNSSNSIYNCLVSSTVIKQNTNSADAETGGIVGYNTSDIIGCRVSDTTIESTGEEVGGVAGENRGWIYSCDVEADVSGISDIGGLVGYMYSGTLNTSTADVYIRGTGDNIGGAVGYTSDGYSGVTINSVKTSGTVEGANNVGGVLGFGRGSDGYTRIIKDCHSSADIYAAGFAGGLIGSAWGEGGHSQASVTRCSASGNVFGTGGAIGGLIGKNRATVSDCYATGHVNGTMTTGGLIGYNLGSVKTSYARGDVLGKKTAGGLIGENTAPVQFTYSTGFVFGESNVGGLVGINTNSVLNSYYDKETSSRSDKGKGIPKATFELMQQMNYISWDFENVWSRRDNYNDGYAYLASLAPAEDAEKVVIEISSEEDLRNIKNNLKGDYVLTDNITLSGEWTPIGSYEHTFRGSLDGKGFEISGLRIPNDGGAYVGLFAVVGGGANISNLTVNIAEDSVVNASSTNSFAGGLAGFNMGRITNCFVNGEVAGQGAVGGLVGKNDGVVAYSGTSGSVNGILNVGGLVGVNGLSVTRSYSSANVTGTTNVGGVIGLNNSSVSSSYAKGNVTAREGYAGGFVGKNIGTISGSSASNNVSSNGDYVGGFAGWNNASGAVINNSSASSVVSGNKNVGGFVGMNQESASINNCYSGSSVYAKASRIGGFAGSNYNKATIVNCYTNAAVSGTTSERGGFAGYNNATITNSYFDSTVAGFTTTYGGTAKTTTQMFTQSEYKGWDFESVWHMNSETPGYPYLAWQSEPGQSPSVIPAVSVAINAPKKEISVGEAVALTATLVPAGATDNVIWNSSDLTTVMIDSNGVILGIKAGKATIEVTAGNAKANVEITVKDEQIKGDIININSVDDIHVPFGSTIKDAENVLPGTVSVVLDNATLISLPVEWSYVKDTEYEFEGTVTLNENITNTNDMKAYIKVIVDEELRAPANITQVEDFALSVSYQTVLESVLSALPESVEVTLSDDTTEKLMVLWNNYSTPEFNPYMAGEYEILGTLILPVNGTVVNPDNLAAKATITVEPMPEKVRNITGAVANKALEVAYGTDLTAVKAMLPANAYAVVEGPVTVSMPVAWSAASIPEYNKYAAGEYIFTGTFLMPEDGMITNTSSIKTTVIVTVLPSTVETKTIYVSETIGEIGHIAETTVSIEENSGMAAGAFCIAFDNTKLTPIDYKVGELIESASVMVNMNYTDPETKQRKVKISFIGNDAIEKGGEIITIRYLVNSELEDNTFVPVTVTNALITDVSNVPMPINTVEGKITALRILLGDVTGDGIINIMDAFKIMRYDVGFIELTDREVLAADVDKNGEIDIFDALKIQKYDIGLAEGLGD